MLKQKLVKDEIRILLINPPLYRFSGESLIALPYGLLSIASYCEHEGYKNIKVYNSDFISNIKKYDSYDVFNEIEKLISEYGPDVVGIGLTTPQYKSSLKIAKICKEINKDILVVVGGPHPTIMPEDTIKEKYYDVLIIGEGEKPFCRMLDSICNYHSLENIKGLSYKKNGKIFYNKDKDKIRNLDDLPLINRDLLLDLGKYPIKELGWIIAERGCFYNCSFCAANKIWGDGVRFRSPKNIVDEIEFIKNKYFTKEFWFQSDSFTAKKKFVKEICYEITKRNLKIIWGCLSRPNEIDEDLIIMMKKAGCHYICMGIESGSQKLLNYIKKNITIKQIKTSVEVIRKNNLLVNLFFMIGFPQETQSSIDKTKNLIDELRPDICIISYYTPLPGTLEYEKQIDNILMDKDCWENFDLRHPNIIKRQYMDDKTLEKTYKELNCMKGNSVLLHYFLNPNFLLIKSREFFIKPNNIKNTLNSLKQYMR